MANDSPTAAPASTSADAWILADVDRALADGLRLRQWWERTDATNAYRDRFHFLENLTPPDHAFGFFADAEIESGPIGVMGYSHEMIFDVPKAGSPEEYRDQIREFVLHYLFRVSGIAPPEPERQLGFGPLFAPLFQLFTERPPNLDVRRGFAHTQLYYKDALSGVVAPFPPELRERIIDLREIGPKYGWVVLRARPFDYEMMLAPSGPAGPRLVIPLPDSPTIALDPGSVIDQHQPAPGILGRYGFSYSLLHDPTPRGPQVYGPAQFRACFQSIRFDVLENGESRVRLIFAGNLPDRILDVKIDPIGIALKAGSLLTFGLSDRLLRPFDDLVALRPTFGSFDPLLGFISTANAATGGLASGGFAISRRQLFSDILARHFQLYYQLILDSLLAYRQVGNWLDTGNLPPWASGTQTQQAGVH